MDIPPVCLCYRQGDNSWNTFCTQCTSSWRVKVHVIFFFFGSPSLDEFFCSSTIAHQKVSVGLSSRLKKQIHDVFKFKREAFLTPKIVMLQISDNVMQGKSPLPNAKLFFQFLYIYLWENWDGSCTHAFFIKQNSYEPEH